jgi:hypothetical protein
MPRHFSNRRLLGRRALYCTSTILWPANNTRTSAIYKFTAALPHHTMFRDTQFAHKIYEACNLTFGSSRLLGNYFHPILKPLCPLSILHHFLESLSHFQFHTYPICSLADSRTGRVHFQFSLTCKEPPSFHYIEISFGILTSAPLSSYIVCTQKF